VLAAGRIRPDGTSLHAHRPVKSGFDTIAFSLFKHLSSSVTGGEISDVDLLAFFNCFFVSHMLPPFMEL
jgi:hypothetical protein